MGSASEWIGRLSFCLYCRSRGGMWPWVLVGGRWVLVVWLGWAARRWESFCALVFLIAKDNEINEDEREEDGCGWSERDQPSSIWGDRRERKIASFFCRERRRERVFFYFIFLFCYRERSRKSIFCFFFFHFFVFVDREKEEDSIFYFICMVWWVVWEEEVVVVLA